MCTLAVLYGQGAQGLAEAIGQSTIFAAHLIATHKRLFKTFWRWAERFVDKVLLDGEATTMCGWKAKRTWYCNERAMMNFSMQAGCAELLHLASSYVVEARLPICGTLHDALLIEAPLAEIDVVVFQVQGCMARASRELLGGFELRSEPKVVRYPDRYYDGNKRGRMVWDTVYARLTREGCSIQATSVSCQTTIVA